MTGSAAGAGPEVQLEHDRKCSWNMTRSALGTELEVHLKQTQKCRTVNASRVTSGHRFQELKYKHSSFFTLPWRQSWVCSTQPLRGSQRIDPSCHRINPLVSLLFLSPPHLYLLPRTKSLINASHPPPCLRVCFVGGTQAEMASGSGVCPE